MSDEKASAFLPTTAPVAGDGIVAVRETAPGSGIFGNIMLDPQEIADMASGGSPGGSDTEVQVNVGGVFVGDPNFTWDAAGQVLTVGGAVRATPGVSISVEGGSSQALSQNGGGADLISGVGGPGFNGGDASVTASNGGAATLGSDGNGGDGGSVAVTAGRNGKKDGVGVDGNAGIVEITGGRCSGAGNAGNAGSVSISGGLSVDGAAGDIFMEAGTASGGGASGNIILTGLPTSDPGVSGAVWNDTGTLKISP